MFNWIDYFMQMFGFNREELTEAETARYVNRSVSTLRAYRCRDYKRVPRIPYKERNRKYYYKKHDLDVWMSGRGMK